MLQELIKAIDETKIASVITRTMAPPPFGELDPREKTSGKVIPQNYFWRRLSTFFRPGDIVVTETGTANFGILDTKFPKDVIAISQVLWGR